MFEEMSKLDGIEYAVSQIRAMIKDGASVEEALKSMEIEHIQRLQGVASRLKTRANYLEVTAEMKNTEVLEDKKGR